MKSIRVLGVAAVVLPVALAAQQPAASRDSTANGLTQSFRAFGAHYGGWLMAAFDSIPASRYDYKPTPPQQTVGYIAQHLEDANYELCALAGGTKRTMTAKDSLADSVKARWPKDTLVARLKASLAFCDTVLAKLDDASLVDTVSDGPPGSQRAIVRVRFLVAYVTDLAEHYSQIAGYMRLNGMTPPSALPRRKR